MSAPSQSPAERLRTYTRLASDDGVVLASVAAFKEAADEIDRLTAEVAKLSYALKLARLYVIGAKCKSLRYENIVTDDTRIVDEVLARAACVTPVQDR